MKQLVTFIIVLLAMLHPTFGQSKTISSESSVPAVQEIIQLENRLFEATKKHDIAFFQHVLADDYLFTSSGASVVTKPGTIKWFDTPVDPATTLEYGDLQIRVYGETGVATGISKASWVLDGIRTTDRDRFIDVFTKRDGRWYLVAGQTTRISREQRPVKM